ncbi:MAG: hypothetical protein ACD_20C00202G0012 [uncultured bacterium]|nr:MAG: hypothetical protein ACD_20C00202G0012 [uncultured bacterium]HBH18377.1 hypothetical protein [Cyanobacteria bacterium UBA9579]
MKINKYSARKGSSLLLAIFISTIALFITAAMLNSSEKNTGLLTNEKSGKAAYYAAEAALSKVTNLYNSDSANWGKTSTALDLPDLDDPETLNNNAAYWIDSIEYVNSNTTAVVNAVGRSGDAYRKLRARITLKIPDIYDDYGLLTDGTLTIHGTKTLNMSIHGNDALSLTGTTTTNNNAIATQSSNSDAGSPDPANNPVGGYVPIIDVPTVPISTLRQLTQQGLNLDLNQADLNEQIMNAPAGNYIYISESVANIPNQNILFAKNYYLDSSATYIPTLYYTDTNILLVTPPEGTPPGQSQSTSGITLYGDMQGKVIFVDGDIDINANGISDLSNVMIISSGTITVNGSVDIGTSHTGKVDTIFASQGDITLNGSRDYSALFWTNGSFTQNGSSLAGRVIAQSGITVNGSFTLTQSDKLYDNNTIDKVAIISSKQQIPMN